MKTKNMKALLSATAVAAALVACFGLAACGSSATSSSAAASSAAASSTAAASSAAASSEAASSASAGAVGEEAGFEETPIFSEPQQVEFMEINAVYFQPVPMTDGSTIEGKDIHLEADISAMDNKFGYGLGDWVPYLTVGYKVTAADGTVAAEGTFMPMSASDGPHYGANIAMPGQGTYTLELTIDNPGESYLLHTDAETGPGATSWEDGANWPIVVSSTWDYVPLEY